MLEIVSTNLSFVERFMNHAAGMASVVGLPRNRPRVSISPAVFARVLRVSSMLIVVLVLALETAAPRTQLLCALSLGKRAALALIVAAVRAPQAFAPIRV